MVFKLLHDIADCIITCFYNDKFQSLSLDFGNSMVIYSYIQDHCKHC